jgi:hypothetical protein
MLHRVDMQRTAQLEEIRAREKKLNSYAQGLLAKKIALGKKRKKWEGV